ncbi:Metallo-beta-lactamase [Gracilaria domingensis]|nr:Metallo-beta-lactamase [Gracilaria domingensis]
MEKLAFTASLPLAGATSARTLTSSRRPPVCAAYRSRRSENIDGNIYVDSSCIDCDICRWVAPDTFTRSNSQSAVYSQPQSRQEKFRALQAMASCPTGSIRTEKPEPLTKEVLKSFPTPGTDKNGDEVQGVYFNGYASEFTFGASSWLVMTSDAAVIFDCPRFSEKLAKNIERVVGDRTLYLALSHRDDVHGHVQWANRLRCLRIIHSAECNRSQMTHQCEIKLRDSDFPYAIADGITLLHTPGHSRGSICLYHKHTKSLFSGDHVAFSNKVGRLVAFKPYNSFSWDAQIQSVASLAEVDFKYIWPGHGRKIEFVDENERRSQLQALVERMKASTESYV